MLPDTEQYLCQNATFLNLLCGRVPVMSLLILTAAILDNLGWEGGKVYHAQTARGVWKLVMGYILTRSGSASCIDNGIGFFFKLAP